MPRLPRVHDKCSDMRLCALKTCIITIRAHLGYMTNLNTLPRSSACCLPACVSTPPHLTTIIISSSTGTKVGGVVVPSRSVGLVLPRPVSPGYTHTHTHTHHTHHSVLTTLPVACEKWYARASLYMCAACVPVSLWLCVCVCVCICVCLSPACEPNASVSAAPGCDVNEVKLRLTPAPPSATGKRPATVAPAGTGGPGGGSPAGPPPGATLSNGCKNCGMLDVVVLFVFVLSVCAVVVGSCMEFELLRVCWGLGWRDHRSGLSWTLRLIPLKDACAHTHTHTHKPRY